VNENEGSFRNAMFLIDALPSVIAVSAKKTVEKGCPGLDIMVCMGNNIQRPSDDGLALFNFPAPYITVCSQR
jgi:hypothetical protein